MRNLDVDAFASLDSGIVFAHPSGLPRSAPDFDPSYEGTRVIAPDVCIAKPVRQQLMRNALAASREPRQALAAPLPEQHKPTVEVTPRASLGLHVLVVDDNIINREVAVAMLEDFGCTVVLADEGRGAVTHAEHERFDLILMDCQMPGMNGYDATAAIFNDIGDLLLDYESS